MRPSAIVGAAALLLSSSPAAGSPSSPAYNTRAVSSPQPIHIPITRRAGNRDAAAFLRKAQAMRNKYGAKSSRKGKRSTGDVSMTNEEDS